MRVLAGCEESAKVRDAFRALGHDAYSNDIIGTRGDSAWHITGDVFKAIKKRGPWDMGIFFPPCTHVCVSGARWTTRHWVKKKVHPDGGYWHDPAVKIGAQREALDFMRDLLECGIPKIAMENPIGVFSTYWREPDQIVQP
jgi:hypothetical protein